MRLAPVCILILAASFAAAAKPPPPEAREHVAAGTRAYTVGNFAAAATEYQAAYELFPSPVLLYNLAQCYRQLGELERARFLYRRYLEEAKPGDRFRPEAESLVKEVEEAIAKKRAAQASPPTGPATAPETPSAMPVVAPPPPPAAPPAAIPSTVPSQVRPWYKDGIAMSLTAIGVAALATGVGLAAYGGILSGRADTAASVPERSQLLGDASTYGTAGYVTLGVGGAFVVAGILKWVLTPSRRSTQAMIPSFAVDRARMMVGLERSF